MGLVLQAVLLTRNRGRSDPQVLNMFNILRATPIFTKIVVSTTLGIFLFSLVAWGLSMFGIDPPHLPKRHDRHRLLASGGRGCRRETVIDFGFIRGGQENGLPKYMEWYSTSVCWSRSSGSTPRSCGALLAMLNRRG